MQKIDVEYYMTKVALDIKKRNLKKTEIVFSDIEVDKRLFNLKNILNLVRLFIFRISPSCSGLLKLLIVNIIKNK